MSHARGTKLRIRRNAHAVHRELAAERMRVVRAAHRAPRDAHDLSLLLHDAGRSRPRRHHDLQNIADTHIPCGSRLTTIDVELVSRRECELKLGQLARLFLVRRTTQNNVLDRSAAHRMSRKVYGAERSIGDPHLVSNHKLIHARKAPVSKLNSGRRREADAVRARLWRGGRRWSRIAGLSDAFFGAVEHPLIDPGSELDVVFSFGRAAVGSRGRVYLPRCRVRPVQTNDRVIIAFGNHGGIQKCRVVVRVCFFKTIEHG
mmetsp:Transcript_14577/g.38990  ORF Transcript_14577/g.38990 Transcript_14577/m.38990 type:complete len:260 (+) Transcript_14577:206-985(+)